MRPFGVANQIRLTGINAGLTSDRYLAKMQVHPGDAGMDLYPLVFTPDCITRTYANFNMVWCIPVGLSLLVPEGYVGIITGRSSSLTKMAGNPVAQSIIDHGYTGPLFVNITIPYEKSPEQENTKELYERLIEFTAQKQAIAQIIFIAYSLLHPIVVTELPKTPRGEKGFGSTDNLVGSDDTQPLAVAKFPPQ